METVTYGDTFKITDFKVIGITIHKHLLLNRSGNNVCKNSAAFILLFFDFLYLFHPGNMPATFEIGGEKDLQYGDKAWFDLLGGQTADLSVVMQSGPLGGKSVVALGRSDALHFVGGDAQ